MDTRVLAELWGGSVSGSELGNKREQMLKMTTSVQDLPNLLCLEGKKRWS